VSLPQNPAPLQQWEGSEQQIAVELMFPQDPAWLMEYPSQRRVGAWVGDLMDGCTVGVKVGPRVLIVGPEVGARVIDELLGICVGAVVGAREPLMGNVKFC
jgi:hypothetical protein